MNKDDFPPEWVAFLVLFSAFYTLEMYAIKTGKVRPFSHLIKRMQVNDPTKYMLLGLWSGFCGWTIKHFFFEE
jgi:hypothetical protein